MRASTLWRLGLLYAAMACGAPAAMGQVILDAPGLLPKPKPPAPPAPRAAPTIWPRLDPGAVLCKTADDLARHAANMAARVRGGDSAPADCRLIAQPVGIQIVSREGLGRTEVKLSGAGNVTGWTDAWLPDKAPAGR
jgi:hypothetical protein